MKHIKLIGGRVAIVDECDYDALSMYKWYSSPNGYVRRNNATQGGKRESVSMHRQIMGLKTGDGCVVDHINGDKLDNRRSNLRVCYQAQNKMNCGSYRSNTSGFKGVTWDKRCGKWLAQIMVNHKNYNLGRFATPEDAHRAYCEAADRMHGEFANHGTMNRFEHEAKEVGAKHGKDLLATVHVEYLSDE